MPRYRTISCDHCGFMQLKRDSECDACGRMTKRERRVWVMRGIVTVVTLLVGIVVYEQIKGLSGLS